MRNDRTWKKDLKSSGCRDGKSKGKDKVDIYTTEGKDQKKGISYRSHGNLFYKNKYATCVGVVVLVDCIRLV